MSSETKIYFRDIFRDARATAYRDSEGFQEILFALEKYGSFLAGKILDLGRYEPYIKKIASGSPLCSDIPKKRREYHLPFDNLYKLVREARNDALHQGAYARHLTDHAVQLSLIIEDALMNNANMISDYMVRDVVAAGLWQPVSFVRQQMLANSFSYMPVRVKNDWKLLSDAGIAKYINGHAPANRKVKLAKSVIEALEDKLVPQSVICCNPDESASAVIANFRGKPLLIVDKRDNAVLLGIVTAFDLL